MDLEAVGAFLSGVGAVLGAGVGIRMLIRRLDKQCDRRLDAFREGLDRGEAAHPARDRGPGAGRRGGVPDRPSSEPGRAGQDRDD
jgi:hypothetical protein